jgi:hypothetical protein
MNLIKTIKPLHNHSISTSLTNIIFSSIHFLFFLSLLLLSHLSHLSHLCSSQSIDTNVPIVFNRIITANIGLSDPVFVSRIKTAVAISYYDALVPFTNRITAIIATKQKKVLPGLPRKIQNKNMAMAYSAYQVLTTLVPEQNTIWNYIMTNYLKLDPFQTTVNASQPIVIGITVGQAVAQAFMNDKANQNCLQSKKKYNCQAFEDYSGYESINRVNSIKDPSRWQPLMNLKYQSARGSFEEQRFVAPYMGGMKAFSFDDVKRFELSPPAVNYTQKNKKYQGR